MHDFLLKIGMPAIAAAVITALVITVPLLFKVDERYAKEVDLKEAILKLEAKNDELKHELAQSVGFQQAMIALLGGKTTLRPTFLELNDEPATGMIKVQAAAPPKPAASAASAVAIGDASVPAKTLPSKKKKLETPQTLKELSEGLYRQQLRLTKE